MTKPRPSSYRDVWVVFAAVGLLGFGCESEPPSEPGVPRILAAHLVAEDEGALAFSGDHAFLIEIYTSDGVDSIPAIRTERVPALAGDSLLTGLIVRDGVTTGAFRYSIHTGEVEELPLPDAGFDPAASGAAISPNGRYIAYISRTSDDLVQLRIDRWPSGEPLMHGPLLRARCVRAPRNEIRWMDPETLDALIDRCGTENRWLRMYGSVTTRTLSSELYTTTDSRLLR